MHRWAGSLWAIMISIYAVSVFSAIYPHRLLYYCSRCKNVNELVSTHGYSQNQIMVWKYPSMSKVQLPAPHISSYITYKAMRLLF
jgi:hypothetical protein